MSSQIFKDSVPSEILFTFLDYIYAFKNEKYYIINSSSYKKAQFMKIIDDFMKRLEPYYHLSKLFYIKREMNYSRFITVIRQVCNSCSIKYTSSIKYINSNYDIHYYIHTNNEEDTTYDDTTDDDNSDDDDYSM